MLETSRDCAKDGKLGLFAMVPIDKPTDHGVEEDDENGSES